MFNVFILLNISSTLAEEIDLDAGEEIFTQNCAACHANGENLVNPVKTLKIDVLHEFQMDSIDAIKRQVTNGNKNGMPAFGGRLSDEDIQNVANYVLNQAQKDLW
uniref:Cytochrome c-553 n=1 Tax=Dictyurus purpurascens TaxID=189649 RepID=A0A4D6WS17_9FLOR|nr:cytochrome c553 [Dictyurus purpurascens]